MHSWAMVDHNYKHWLLCDGGTGEVMFDRYVLEMEVFYVQNVTKKTNCPK